MLELSWGPGIFYGSLGAFFGLIVALLSLWGVRCMKRKDPRVPGRLPGSACMEARFGGVVHFRNQNRYIPFPIQTSGRLRMWVGGWESARSLTASH